ncbi:MAG: HNH endonuclease [bacterium]|nr:HNH endonuclease [bacterium]
MSRQALSPHHAAWLEAHPRRSEAWLQDATAEGFDVHHLDGDKTNDRPDNLVLLECEDHMRLHNGGRMIRKLVRTSNRWGEKRAPKLNSGAPGKPETHAGPAESVRWKRGKMAYPLRAKNLLWKHAADLMGLPRKQWNLQASSLLCDTAYYAKIEGLEWPIPCARMGSNRRSKN